MTLPTPAVTPVPVDNSVAAVERTLARFARTTDQAVTLDELRRRMLSGRRLRMKYGVDLTAPDLHLGHAVNLWMYRAMQDLGHQVVLLLGDFTTRIGDPTGRSRTRPVLTEAEIARNAAAIQEQALTVLRTEPELLEVRRNSEWTDAMTPGDFLRLMANATVEKLLSRDMFRARTREGLPISAHELVYPLVQGWDSVALGADLVIIGSDQLFNEMMGRQLQERQGQQPQTVLTTVITPGLDGGEKQSKSLGNYVALGHSPREKFGRLMRLPDGLVGQYLAVYTALPDEEVARVTARQADEPFEAKLDLAEAVVARYHGAAAGRRERAWFQETFSERRTPADAPLLRASAPVLSAFALVREAVGPEASNAELRRLIGQGGLRVDGERVDDPDRPVRLPSAADAPVTVRLGKRRWFRVSGPA